MPILMIDDDDKNNEDAPLLMPLFFRSLWLQLWLTMLFTVVPVIGDRDHDYKDDSSTRRFYL